MSEVALKSALTQHIGARPNPVAICINSYPPSMAPSVALRIPYEPKSETGTRNLQDDIQQLVKQKGQFHSITEQNLLRDQALSRSNGIDAEKSENEDEDDLVSETQQQTLERLQRARGQMINELR